MSREHPQTSGPLYEGSRPERVSVSLRVRLTNSRESFEAITVDVSRTGVLFRLDRTGLLDGMEGDPLLAVTRRVEQVFGRGLTVIFGGGILRRRMRVVRVLQADEGIPLLACNFQRPLASDDCELLGIPEAEGSWESWDAANVF